MEFALRLEEQQKKLLNYCYETAGKEPPYVEREEEFFVGECPDLAIEKIIDILTKEYIKSRNNKKMTDLIDETIVRLTELLNEIMENYDFSGYFKFLDK